MKRLQDKVAVIYGAGTVGIATAKAFAREGPKVYLTGRRKEKLDDLAIPGVETSVLDALNEHGVEVHLDGVVRASGRVDISFNAIGIPQTGIQGIGITDLPVESFMHPITTYAKSHFITAKTAARRMVKQGSGVILMHTPNASHISPPFVGGMIPAWSAIEALARSISVECGADGVRSVCLLTTGIPETPLIDDVWEIHGKSHGVSFEQFHAGMESLTHRRKLTTLDELTNTAVFIASDEGSAISGTIVNLTAGMII